MLVYIAEWATEHFSIRNRGNVLIRVLSPVVIGSDTTPRTTHWDTRQEGCSTWGYVDSWFHTPGISVHALETMARNFNFGYHSQ